MGDSFYLSFVFKLTNLHFTFSVFFSQTEDYALLRVDSRMKNSEMSLVSSSHDLRKQCGVEEQLKEFDRFGHNKGTWVWQWSRRDFVYKITVWTKFNSAHALGRVIFIKLNCFWVTACYLIIELNTVSYSLVGYLQPLLAWLLNLMADKGGFYSMKIS